MLTDEIQAYTRIEDINGVPYKDWTKIWWLWALQGPKANNPVFDPDGHNADNNQPTKYDVKFLAGTFDRTFKGKDAPERKIRADDKTSLLIPIVNSNISREEHDNVFNATNNNISVLSAANEIISQGKGSLSINKGGSTVEFTIDGKGANTPTRIYDDGLTLLSTGQGIVQSNSGSDLDFMRSALDGFWVFLKPLDADEYIFTIHGEAPWFGGSKGEPNFVTDVTYKVTIEKA